MKRLRRYTAEALGTFALVFVGCGAIMVDSIQDGAIGHFGISVIFGLIIMAMIYSYGNVSGAHFNPAVTVAFFFADRICFRSTILYIVSQVIGGIIAALILKAILPEAGTLGATIPTGDVWQSVVLETVLTFILMTVILNVSTGHKEEGIMAGIAIGGFIALAAAFGGPISGASMNPARSLAPALVSGNWQYIWIYLTAPFAGAMLAIPLFKLVQGGENTIIEKG